MKLLLLFLLAFGCGQEKVETRYVEVPVEQPDPDPDPDPDPGGGGTTVSFTEMQDLLDTYCSQCHASSPFMQNEANLRRSTAKDRIWSRNMPPNNAATELGEADRRKMLIFFQ